jgi:GMP synthase (glutamine-hydrolysing)
MIVLINISKESFHYFEFIKPIEDILNRENEKYITVNYKNCDDSIVFRADKVIIAGTSLKDNGFLDDRKDFYWIKNFNKPILGICGGMHLLGLVFDGILKKQQEIGLTEINFKKKFLGIKNTHEVYELHNYYVESSDFDIYSTSKHCPQAIRHKEKPFFGVLFHPEVRNKKLIEYFLKTTFN